MDSTWQPRRSKRNVVLSEGYESKKSSGIAVWSEGDEVLLLKGMIDYEVLNKSNPYDHLGKFFDFVSPSISFDVENKQVTNKLRKLKDKFLNNKYDSSRPHHAKLVELSESIKCWGLRENGGDDVIVGDVEVDKLVENEGKGKKRKHVKNDKEVNVLVDDVGGEKSSEVIKSKKGKVVENKGKGKEVENKGKGQIMICDGKNDNEHVVVLGNENVRKQVNKKDLDDSTCLYPELTRELELTTLSGMSKKYVKDIISSIGRKKASELEKNWADVHLMEIELNAKKLELSNGQIKVILEAAHKSKPSATTKCAD